MFLDSLFLWIRHFYSISLPENRLQNIPEVRWRTEKKTRIWIISITWQPCKEIMQGKPSKVLCLATVCWSGSLLADWLGCSLHCCIHPFKYKRIPCIIIVHMDNWSRRRREQRKAKRKSNPDSTSLTPLCCTASELLNPRRAKVKGKRNRKCIFLVGIVCVCVFFFLACWIELQCKIDSYCEQSLRWNQNTQSKRQRAPMLSPTESFCNL